MLLEVAQELRREGLPCPENAAACRRYTPFDAAVQQPTLPEGWALEPGAAAVLEGLSLLLRRMEAQSAALREREEANRAEGQGVHAGGPAAVPYEKWLKAQQEADRLRVEVDLLKIALEEAEKGGSPEEKLQEQ
jgi:hypothetical protein